MQQLDERTKIGYPLASKTFPGKIGLQDLSGIHSVDNWTYIDMLVLREDFVKVFEELDELLLGLVEGGWVTVSLTIHRDLQH